MKKTVCLLIFLLLSAPVLASDSSPVIMNVKTFIYHSPNCKWAKRCTKNCIKTTKDKAKSQGDLADGLRLGRATKSRNQSY